jgi:hypothetical protein
MSTNVSEELPVPVFKSAFLHLSHCSTLKMEAASASETLVLTVVWITNVTYVHTFLFSKENWRNEMWACRNASISGHFQRETRWVRRMYNGEGFPRVPHFPLPIRIPRNVPLFSSRMRVWYSAWLKFRGAHSYPTWERNTLFQHFSMDSIPSTNLTVLDLNNNLM